LPPLPARTRPHPHPPATFFASAASIRAWLAQDGATHSELIVGYWKVATGRPSMSWPESVDEALCFGWIDGVPKRIDDASYLTGSRRGGRTRSGARST
jgi:uncharacterized protein YdeI (YjbR/CyaY-like superfamily)